MLDLFPETPLRDRFIKKFPALILTTAEIARAALDIDFNLEDITNYFVEHEKLHGNDRSTVMDAYDKVIDACHVQENTFRCRNDDNKFDYENDNEPRGDVNGKISYPKKIMPDGRILAEEYAIRKPFLENIFNKEGFQNKRSILSSWRDMGLLDCDKDGRFTRSRKITKKGKGEDVYVLRVFADANDPTLSAPDKIPRAKPVKTRSMKELLGDDEDDECS